jgi:hypothetical protein
MSYVLSKTIAPGRTSPFEIDVEETFNISRVLLEQGDGLRVTRALSNQREITKTDYSLKFAVNMLTVFKPPIEKGTFRIDIYNPTTKPIFFRIAIE